MPEAHGQDGVLHFKVDFCVLIVSGTVSALNLLINVYFANTL